MLETVDFSREPLSKDAYKARRDELMERLVVLQQFLQEFIIQFV